MDHDHTDVILTPDHLADGGVGYAYASTAHKAQGGTWDLAITVGVDGLYREAGYLVMSRGRASNWLIVTAPELDALDTELGRHDSPHPAARRGTRLGRRGTRSGASTCRAASSSP